MDENTTIKYYPMVRLDGEWRYVHAIYATTIATTKGIHEGLNTTSKDLCISIIEWIKNQYQYDWVRIIEMTISVRDVVDE